MFIKNIKNNNLPLNSSTKALPPKLVIEVERKELTPSIFAVNKSFVINGEV